MRGDRVRAVAAARFRTPNSTLGQHDTFIGHAIDPARRQRIEFDQVDAKRQFARLEPVAQIGTLPPAQPKRLNHQQVQVGERPRSTRGARVEHTHLGVRKHAVEGVAHDSGVKSQSLYAEPNPPTAAEPNTSRRDTPRQRHRAATADCSCTSLSSMQQLSAAQGNRLHATGLWPPQMRPTRSTSAQTAANSPRASATCAVDRPATMLVTPTAIECAGLTGSRSPPHWSARWFARHGLRPSAIRRTRPDARPALLVWPARSHGVRAVAKNGG